MVIDLGVRFGEHVGRKLAETLGPLKPDIMVGAATLGIPVAIEVSPALGLDRYVILQKSRRSISATQWCRPSRRSHERASSACSSTDRLRLCWPANGSWWSTTWWHPGSSLKGSLDLVRKAGGEVVGVGIILAEAHDWQETLGADRRLVHGLAHIPQFRRGANGWEPFAFTFL